MTQNNNETRSMKKHLVWDIPTRLFHWLLVFSLLAQYATAKWLDGYMDWHFYIGYFTLGLILYRVVWGIVGTRHARFWSFFPTPSKIMSYGKTLFKRDSEMQAGHNPIGAIMVFVLLALVGTQAVSGLFVSDDVLHDGPYNGIEDQALVKTMSWLHHNVFDWLLIAIGLHVAAVLVYLWYKKQNLIQPMVTGKKPVDESHKITSSGLIRAAIVLAVVVASVYYAVEVAPPEPVEDYFFY